MISFYNSGEIDSRLITTLGCNVKDGNSPIGYFGTGLKYAIAVLLREHQQITIWSGLTRYEFGLSSESIRGKEFQLITMNGAKIGYTTEYGKNWTVENAYRELWCNTKDEGGSFQLGPAEPTQGQTWIEVAGARFHEAHSSRWNFLLDPARVPIFAIPGIGELYYGSSEKIFYRGVATSNTPGAMPTRYTYNLLKTQRLTEDRTLASDWEAWCNMAEILGRCPDRTVLTNSLRDELGGEKHFSFSYAQCGEDFFEVARELYHVRRVEMNANAKEAFLRKKGKPKPNWRKIELNSEESTALSAALHFWGRVGFEVNYPINLVASIPAGESTRLLACAEDGEIWLTPECFANEELLRVALLEEFIHLRSQVHDETREMQNVLFSELHRVAEIVND